MEGGWGRGVNGAFELSGRFSWRGGSVLAALNALVVRPLNCRKAMEIADRH
ncbi:hypothetical protein Q31a_02800 [Aureliella helgolandensis]|uniref:Uncharacterized protein n=1 Tax=Aureliella helgolandensis TaxID=2527968 RepID=A0A518G078_9BACT|nr:hypothetical protein Q31a_02800 [Aureliella helgolandensis]